MDVLSAPVKVAGLKATLIAAGLLGVLLLGSVAANVLLFNEWQGARERAAAAEANLATANKATESCNASISGLEKAAEKRGAAASAARARAKAKAATLEQQAQRELSTPATVPGDDCKSAQDRVTRILSERGRR